MQVKTKALVLSAIKYQEKSLIVKCLTHSAGVKSYFIRNAFSKGKQAQNAAYFQPLTLLEIEATHKDNGGLQYIKEIKLAHPYHSIYTDFYKNTTAIFLAEMLHLSIREEEANEALFQFLEAALLWLDYQEEAPNFHLILLTQMTKYLGFYPGGTLQHRGYFNPLEGVFTPWYSPVCFDEDDSLRFASLLALSFRQDPRQMSGSERRKLLKLLLEYYQLHVTGFKRPNSLDVIIELFS